jgi:glucokinase
MAALGEAWKGGGQGCENMLLVTFGTGVGGGILLNGRPLNGVHGSAGEIGHLVMEPQETEACGCGKRGCAEQYCSATGIVRLANKHLAASEQASVLRQTRNLTCKDVFDAGEKGDAVALEILEQVYDYMGRLLANVCNTLDPEVVVLGGGVSRAGQPLLEGAYRAFQNYVYHSCADIRFRLATLENDAGVCGAFKLVLDAQTQ